MRESGPLLTTTTTQQSYIHTYIHTTRVEYQKYRCFAALALSKIPRSRLYIYIHQENRRHTYVCARIFITLLFVLHLLIGGGDKPPMVAVLTLMHKSVRKDQRYYDCVKMEWQYCICVTPPPPPGLCRWWRSTAPLSIDFWRFDDWLGVLWIDVRSVCLEGGFIRRAHLFLPSIPKVSFFNRNCNKIVISIVWIV